MSCLATTHIMGSSLLQSTHHITTWRWSNKIWLL